MAVSSVTRHSSRRIDCPLRSESGGGGKDKVAPCIMTPLGFGGSHWHVNVTPWVSPFPTMRVPKPSTFCMKAPHACVFNNSMHTAHRTQIKRTPFTRHDIERRSWDRKAIHLNILAPMLWGPGRWCYSIHIHEEETLCVPVSDSNNKQAC